MNVLMLKILQFNYEEILVVDVSILLRWEIY